MQDSKVLPSWGKDLGWVKLEKGVLNAWKPAVDVCG